MRGISTAVISDFEVGRSSILSAPFGHDAPSSSDHTYARKVEARGHASTKTQAPAIAADGIPRTVILDEHQVCDHYMRRINRVWTRRIEVREEFRFVACILF